MRKRIAATVLGVALLGLPAVAQGEKNDAPGYERSIEAALRSGDYRPFEERYLRLYDRYADEFGVEAVGRNIVFFGANTGSGAREPSREQVRTDSDEMELALNPPATEAQSTRRATTARTSSTSRPGTPTRRTAMRAPTRRPPRPPFRTRPRPASHMTRGHPADPAVGLEGPGASAPGPFFLP
jgi:hypothetical protein